MVYLHLLGRWARRPVAARVVMMGATLLISMTPAARAQTGTDIQPDITERGGRGVIQGSVHYPGGRRLDYRAKVTLRGVNLPERFSFTNDSGAFTFAGLRGGSYTVTVEAGKDYEAASENVDLFDSGGGRGVGGPAQTVNVRIELRAKQAAPQVVGTVAVISEEALALYKQAVTAAGGGDRKRAIETLERAIALCPNFWTAWNEIGVQHLRLGQPAKALDALRAAGKIEPQAFEPRLNTGIALLQMKDYARAAAALQSAIEKKSDSAAARLHMGHALLGLSRLAEAER
ncbi:MAG TPA: tetratricopeptide repeat protein, partial [Blastocatellia bacterium]|nr:tetratricopeptide repeat protein [Blastocatellia bacterium]